MALFLNTGCNKQKIEDQELLAEIAKNDEDKWVRYEAVKKLEFLKYKKKILLSVNSKIYSVYPEGQKELKCPVFV